jgi:transcriptional regulator with XRE-family HTH domain
MLAFRHILKSLRVDAGFGLREFARLINESPGNYSNIESGKRSPWQSHRKLEVVANELHLRQGTPESDRFFMAARNWVRLPPDIEHVLFDSSVIQLLRTIAHTNPTSGLLLDLIIQLKERTGK